MRLMVCPRTRLAQFQDAPVTHFVSLLDPDEAGKELPVPRSAEERLDLVFSDLDDIEVRLPRFRKYNPPSSKDVARIISFGKALSDMDDWGLLAHCEAGISRSTAAAIAMLAAAGYPPQVAFGLVRRVCPEMLPNRRILRLADEQLGTRGLLHRMAENHRQKAFLRAGYEDPTNILLAEFEEASKRRPGLLVRLLSVLPSGWRNLVGSGARMREALRHRETTGRQS